MTTATKKLEVTINEQGFCGSDVRFEKSPGRYAANLRAGDRVETEDGTGIIESIGTRIFTRSGGSNYVWVTIRMA